MKQHKIHAKPQDSQPRLLAASPKEDQRLRHPRKTAPDSDQEENSPPSSQGSPVSGTLANDRRASHRPNHPDDRTGYDNPARHAFEELHGNPAAGRPIDRDVDDENNVAEDDAQDEDYAPPPPPPAFSTTNGLLNSGTSTKPWESRPPRMLTRRVDANITDDNHSSERRYFTSKHHPSQNVVEVVIETPPPQQMKSEPILQSTPINGAFKPLRSTLPTLSPSTPLKFSVPDSASTREIWDVDTWGERSPSASPRYTNMRRTNGESSNGIVGRTELEMRYIRESPTKTQRKSTARQNINNIRVASPEKSTQTHKTKMPSIANKTQAHTPTPIIFDDENDDDELHATYGSDSEYAPVSPATKFILQPKSAKQPAIAPASFKPGILVPFMSEPWSLPRDELLPGLDEKQFQWLAAFWNAYGDDVKIPIERAETVVRMSGCLKMAQARRFWNVMRRRKRRDNREKMPSTVRGTEGDGESMEEEMSDNVCVTCGKACLHCEAAERTEREALEDKVVNAVPAPDPTGRPTRMASTSVKRKREEDVAGEKRRKSKRCAGEEKPESVTSKDKKVEAVTTMGVMGDDGGNGEVLNVVSIDNKLSPTPHNVDQRDRHRLVDENSRGETINLLGSNTADTADTDIATTPSSRVVQGEKHGKGVTRIDKVDVAETVISNVSSIVLQEQFNILESPDLEIDDHIGDTSTSDVSITILASGVISQDQLALIEKRDDTFISDTPVDEVDGYTRRRSSRIRVPIYEDLNEKRVARQLLQAAEKELALSKRRRSEPDVIMDTSDMSDSVESVPATSSRSTPGRTGKRRRFEVDANASMIETTNETDITWPIVTHAKAFNDWRRIPLESVHLQRNRCTNTRYQRMPRCRACTRKQSDDTLCRFQTFRAFEILHPPLVLRKDLFTTVQTKENIKLYEVILNVPLFVSSTDPDPQYRIARPNRSDKPLRSRIVEAFVLRSISQPLEAMLTRELAHSKDNSCFRRLPAPYVRHLCDYCLTSIFNSYWTCSACGVDMCIECFEEWRSKGKGRGKISSADLDRRFACTQENLHTVDQMLKMTKFTKKTLENVRKATAVVKNMEWNEKHLLMEEGPADRDVAEVEVEEVEVELEGTLSMIPFTKAITEGAAMEDAPGKKPRARSTARARSTEYAPTPESLDQATHELSRPSQQRATPPMESFVSPNPDIFGSSPLSAPCDSPLQSPLSSFRPLSPLLSSLHPPTSPPALSFLCTPAASASLSAFQDRWRKGEAVVVRRVLSESKIKWAPEYFIQNYGTRGVEVIDCETGEAVESTVEKFFAGFEDLEKREKRPDDKFKVLKLKDWPPRQDFREEFPDLYEDFMTVLPFKDYTGTNGVLNLASRLPDTFVPPDLGPKMYIAYGSDDGEQGKGTTNLHCDMADAVNVMFYSSPVDQTSERKKVAAAVWDIYPAGDLPKIKKFLAEHARDLKRKIVDPVHDQWIYLDATLRYKLWEKYKVRSWRVYQDPGDAVFIPAGCAHQVCNYAAAVKCAMDFVSPENVARCADLTQEFRLMKRRKEDMLQLRNILFFAWASSDRFLGETSEEAGRGKKAKGSKEAEDKEAESSKETERSEPWCGSVGSKLVLEVPWDEFVTERNLRRLKVRKNEEMYARAAEKKRQTIAKKIAAKDATGIAEDWEESASDVTAVSRGTPEPGETNGRGTSPMTTLEMRENGEENLGDWVTPTQKASVRKLRGRKEDGLSDSAAAEFKSPETTKGGREAKRVGLAGRENNLQCGMAADISLDLTKKTKRAPGALFAENIDIKESLRYVTCVMRDTPRSATNATLAQAMDSTVNKVTEESWVHNGLAATNTSKPGKGDRKSKAKELEERVLDEVMTSTPLFNSERRSKVNDARATPSPAKRGRKPIVKKSPGASDEEFQITSGPAKRGRKPKAKGTSLVMNGKETPGSKRGRKPMAKRVTNGEETPRPAKRGRKPLAKKTPAVAVEGGETTLRKRGRPPKFAAVAERNLSPQSPPRGGQVLVFDTITVEREVKGSAESTNQTVEHMLADQEVTETTPMESPIIAAPRFGRSSSEGSEE